MTVLVVGCTRVEPDPTEAKVAVDPGVKHQEIGGFGGALAFYENWVKAAPMKEDIYDLIFDDLGLDILRLRNVYDYPLMILIPCGTAWSFIKPPKRAIPALRYSSPHGRRRII